MDGNFVKKIKEGKSEINSFSYLKFESDEPPYCSIVVNCVEEKPQGTPAYRVWKQQLLIKIFKKATTNAGIALYQSKLREIRLGLQGDQSSKYTDWCFLLVMP